MSLPQWVRDEIDNRAAREHDAELITEARAWLADLKWADEPDFAAMTDERIRRGVQRHYGGGWAAFVSDAA
jgi:hypothetical protein